MEETALIYCEGHFNDLDGKTANGLIRHSKKYQIVGVIDSHFSGMDSGMILDGKKNKKLIYFDLTEAVTQLEKVPNCFIFGLAPKEAFLSITERRVILDAMDMGMNIIIGLHEFITEDEEFIQASQKNHVRIEDIRKPKPKKYLNLYTGDIRHVKIPKIGVFGTDCAVGKRTTALLLTDAFEARGLKVLFVGSGQTSLIQGEKYGVAMDAMTSEFMTGEFEHVVLEGVRREKPDIILIEGQSAMSHPAFISTCAIIRGSMPDAIILQHPPKREVRVDFSEFSMPEVGEEIKLLESYSKAPVLAITLNHEKMNIDEINETIGSYEQNYDIPTTDPLVFGCDKLIDAIINRFPKLLEKYKEKAEI